MDTSIIADKYCIGRFGDKRLSDTGKLLHSRIAQRNTVSLRELSDDRAMQRRFHLFLSSPKVTAPEITRVSAERTARAAKGRHVLAIQDTSELNYTAHIRSTDGLGKLSGDKGRGLVIHPTLVVDAQSHACLGLVHQSVWVRAVDAPKKPVRRPIEEKESRYWIEGAEAAAKRLHEAESVTVVADRESDIYELWDRIPDGHTHVLTRAHYDRQLDGGGTLLEWLKQQRAMTCYVLDVPERPASKAYRSCGGARIGAHVAHKAHIELRYGSVTILRPKECKAGQEKITMSAIELHELPDTVPPNEQPVHWILLTDHEISDVEKAFEAVDWYQQRWQIEQLFRTLKRQGLDIEASQLRDVGELLNLACIATDVAARTMQLVNARDGNTDQPASDTFEEKEVQLLEKLQEKLEGKTIRQKNPYPAYSLAWASWSIARLGGWKGGSKEAKPGPITMMRGLKRFDGAMLGWEIANIRA